MSDIQMEEIEFLKSLLKRRRNGKPIPVETIEEILKERLYICELCNTRLVPQQQSDRKRQLHHIIPRRSSGNNKKENLMLICGKCHSCMESTIHAGEILWRTKIRERIKHIQDINGKKS